MGQMESIPVRPHPWEGVVTAYLFDSVLLSSVEQASPSGTVGLQNE